VTAGLLAGYSSGGSAGAAVVGRAVGDLPADFRDVWYFYDVNKMIVVLTVESYSYFTTTVSNFICRQQSAASEGAKIQHPKIQGAKSPKERERKQSWVDSPNPNLELEKRRKEKKTLIKETENRDCCRII
jgi:hypothetical protein